MTKPCVISLDGTHVRVVSTMQSAPASLRTHDFALIVLDINLPNQTGWEMLHEALHEGTLHPYELAGMKLPVVILSAVQISPRRLGEFRPLAYLPEPFPLDSLAAEAVQRRIGGAAIGEENTEHLHRTSSE